MVEGYETVEQVAQRLGISTGRIRQLLGEGRLPRAVKVAGAWFIPAGTRPDRLPPGRPSAKKVSNP